ncbi:MAG: cation diffusion facilitator family transporter [Pontiellaceae bacterium]|jgi:cation diffusion facilitator family transporter|nr:cation diffusion facilitator family transporter [Pontiellaceae bacterium]
MNSKHHSQLSSAEQTGQVLRITWIGFAINVVLTSLKFFAGIAGHSQAAVADAIHSFSDLGTDIAVLFGVRLWSAPADACHPYGHRRIETLITVLIGAALAAVAVGFSLDAVDKLRHPPELSPTLIALTGSLLTIFLKEWLFRRTRTVGQRVNSPAVIANAWHHRSDAFSSIPVVIAVGAATFNPEWHFLDQIGALIVAAMILKAAWDITKPALAELIDVGATQQDYRQIVEISQGVGGVQSVHKIRTRRSGAGLYVDLHAVVDGQITVRAGHDIATQLQRKLIVNGPAVADVVVHIEPADK